MSGRYGPFTMDFFSQMLLGFLGFLFWISCTIAQPAVVPFHDCFAGNASQQLNVSTIYAQLFPHSSMGTYLNFTLLGDNPQEIIPFSDGPDPVATTLFTASEMLTFTVWTNNSFFCSTVRPQSPLPSPSSQGNFCPLPAGPFALSTTVLPGNNYELVTFYTRLRAVDPFQQELFCLDIDTTPLKPGPVSSIYGHARYVFWGTIALAAAYWMVVGLARLVSAWGRGSTRGGPGLWGRMESAGFIVASAISGERLATSPALMRFCTPSLRDIIFHSQWCAALSMVAVQWPTFAYPLLSQASWSTLSYNTTIKSGTSDSTRHWDPLSVPPYNPPSNFADQLNDPTTPIFIDSSAPNFLFQLPSDAKPGISSFAYSVGVLPQDLFGQCLILFLGIMAAMIVLSVVVWGIDWIAARLLGSPRSHSPPTFGGSKSPRYSAGSKDMLDSVAQFQNSDENRSVNSHFLLRSTAARWAWPARWRFRNTFVSLHGSVLQGNLVRILILFHLPVTIFSCYQFTLDRSQTSLSSIILAGISFAILSVLAPLFLVFRLSVTNTTKLYDETWTLLFLGPLYNHYRHGSQLFACLLFATNLAFGITIGCGQKSGTAQAIIILVIEVSSALGTSIWLPWGQGASMGLISFLFCVARIVIAVLLVILTPIVSVGTGAAQWVAYAILFILALVYLAFILMLIVKLAEGVVRIAGGVGFHRSRHAVDSGLLGAMGQVGCCGPRRAVPANRRYRADDLQPPSLPLHRPTLPYKDTTPTPSGPPSVLRPEHAWQPYKEESDDETGYIMGAWQPFPRPGYSAVEDRTPTTPEIPKSGFARVGGGRAHFDSPYAIASGSTQTFPSVDKERRETPTQLATPPIITRDPSPPLTPSLTGTVTAKTAEYLPPGAMPPVHTRTKSQTAIIENAGTPVPLVATSTSQHGLLSSSGSQDIYDDGIMLQSKKKHWYNLRKARRASEPDSSLQRPQDLSSGSAPDTSEPGKSFVVVRKKRPGTGNSQGSSEQQPPAERSFTVMRGNNQDPSS